MYKRNSGRSKPPIYLPCRQHSLYVIKDALGLGQGADGCGAHLDELAVGDGEDEGVVGGGGLPLRPRQLRQAMQPIFVLGLRPVDPGVVNVDANAVFAQGVDDVHHPGVAQVGAVFLEGQAEDEDPAVADADAALQHEFDHGLRDVGAHAVVDAPAGEDDLGVIANGDGLVGEVVGVDADAVAADQAGAEGQEVPFAAGGFQHFQGVDAELAEDQRQFVHQGDVEVALGVLDDLGRLGDADAAGAVGAGGDDLAVEGVDDGGDFRAGAAGDLFNGGEAVVRVAGVDALGAVAEVEGAWRIPPLPRPLPHQGGGEKYSLPPGGGGLGRGGRKVFQPRPLLQHRGAVFLGATGIDGGFVDDQVARLEDLADGGGGLEQGREVGALVLVHRGGDGDDEDPAGAQGLGVAGDGQVPGGGQFFGCGLAGAITAGLKLGDALGLDVEADHRAVLAKFHGQGQADVAEADDGQGGVRGGEVAKVQGVIHGEAEGWSVVKSVGWSVSDSLPPRGGGLGRGG